MKLWVGLIIKFMGGDLMKIVFNYASCMLGVFFLLSNVSKATPPKGFEGKILEDVYNGKIVTTVSVDGAKDYQIYLRAFIRGASASKYVDLVTNTAEYHHLVPEAVSNSTDSTDVGNSKYQYQLDVVVHYGPLPITLYANVVREVVNVSSESTIKYAYLFQGFENYMSPLIETTRIMVDADRPESGIFVEDVITIHMIEAPSNAKVMKSELSKTYTRLLKAFKKRLDG
jgi:hypothetical protein